MATNEDPEELVVCPYDPVHVLRRKRMPYHLMKCRKQFNPKHFKPCPFNARHVVPTQEFDYHIRNCPDMGVLDQRLMQQQNSNTSMKGYTAIPAQNADFVVPESEESWDTDNCESYRPPAPTGLLFSSEPGYTSRKPAVSHQQPPLPQIPIEEPPKPRLPQRDSTSEESQVYTFSRLSNQQPQKPQAIGRGRGRGRGGLRPVALATPPGLPGGLQQIEPVTEESSPPPLAVPVSNSSSASEGSDLSEQEKYKRQRKLDKMLRQILKIEELQASGVAINKDQLEKLERKHVILKQLGMEE